MYYNIIKVNTKKVTCNGGYLNQLGHPTEYLCISNHSLKVKCPYCSNLFVYEELATSKLCLK